MFTIQISIFLFLYFKIQKHIKRYLERVEYYLSLDVDTYTDITTSSLSAFPPSPYSSLSKYSFSSFSTVP